MVKISLSLTALKCR